MSTSLLHTTPAFHALAMHLATSIDCFGGGHPAVTLLSRRNPAMEMFLWQYGMHDFHVYVDRSIGQTILIETAELPTEIVLPSGDDALELIQLTESIRQDTKHPLVHLGIMPGTDLTIQTRPSYGSLDNYAAPDNA